MTLKHDNEVRLIVEECMILIGKFEYMNLYATDLLKIETILSARLIFLLGKKSKYQYEQNSAYWVRKLEHSRGAIKARKSGEIKNQQMADHMANIDNIDQINAENRSVWRYEHLKGFCGGIEKILISIAHRLKDLSSEKISSNTQQG